MTDLEFVAALRGHCEAVAKGLPRVIRISRRVWGDEEAEVVEGMEARPLYGKLGLLEVTLDSLLDELTKEGK